MSKTSVAATDLNISIICYLFEKHRKYAEMIKMIDGRDMAIIDVGHRRENCKNIYYKAVIELDGIRQMVNCAIFEDTLGWYQWQRENEALADNIGMVIVGKENDLVDRYSSGVLVCATCDVPTEVFKLLSEITLGAGTLCAKYLCKLDSLERSAILSRYAIERMEDKHNNLIDIYMKFGEDWESRFIAMLFDAIAVSDRRNRKYFNILAQNIGYKAILRNLKTVEEIEALLFGAAGMLNYCKRHDEYAKKLLTCYLEMKRVYGIKEMDGSVWKYKGMCKDNNLYIVVAQLASILFHTKDISLRLSNDFSLDDIYKIILCQTSEYWFTHDYLSDDETIRHGNRDMSKARKERLVINGFVPFLFSYYRQNDMYEKTEELITMLENIDGEDNALLDLWKTNGVTISNALISQSLIQISKTLCPKLLCTECLIGRKMLG